MFTTFTYGSKGKLAIGAADAKETKRQNKQIERKEKTLEQKEKREQQQREQKENIEVVELQEGCDDAENSEEESSTETKDDEPKRKRCRYNTHKIVNIALTSLSNGAGLRQAAEIATATLIDYNIVTQEDTSNGFDHNKVVVNRGIMVIFIPCLVIWLNGVVKWRL